MNAQSNLFLKRVGQFTVVSVLTISMIALGEQQSLAIPLEPILDRIGRSMVEKMFNIDSAAQTPPPAQPYPNMQPETSSSPKFPLDPSATSPPITPPTNPTYPPSTSPAPSNYPPSTPYPQSYPTYPQHSEVTPPVYSAPTYPPTNPVYPPGRSHP
jgi:hypothetical protein